MTTNTIAQPEPRLIRVGEAARMISVSRTKLYQMMKSGDLPYCTMGGSRRIPRAAIDKLIEETMVGASAG